MCSSVIFPQMIERPNGFFIHINLQSSHEFYTNLLPFQNSPAPPNTVSNNDFSK